MHVASSDRTSNAALLVDEGCDAECVCACGMDQELIEIFTQPEFFWDTAAWWLVRRAEVVRAAERVLCCAP